ncbi:MAG TPA: hypothetical protein VF530_23670, partial [Planctomycetota bacterium]
PAHDRPMEGTQTFGERFLEEWKRLGGPLAGWSYAELQEIKGCDQEGLAMALRRNHSLVSYAAIQRVRSAQNPEDLARELHSRSGAHTDAGPWIMLSLLS